MWRHKLPSDVNAKMWEEAMEADLLFLALVVLLLRHSHSFGAPLLCVLGGALHQT